MKKPPKNDYMTVRDPDSKIRADLDRLRLRESQGKEIPMSRTDMIRLLVSRALEDTN